MARLTNSIDYCAMHCDFGKRGECFFKDKSKCYEKSMHDKLKAFEDIIDEPEKLLIVDKFLLEKCEEINKLAAELAEYKKLEEKGLILRLPISEDTPVYSIEYCCGKNKENKMGMCFRGFCEGCSDKSYYIKEGKAKQCSISEINRSVFLTKEEAEQALERMKEV